MEKVDWHIHTSFSDGQQSVEELISYALKMGLESIAITDHYDPFDSHLVNKNVSVDALLDHLRDIKRIGEKSGIKVFAGIETATAMDGSLRLADEIVSSCDMIICSPHYIEHDYPLYKGEIFNDRYWQDYKQLLLNQATNEADIAGHPEGYLPCENMLEGSTFDERQMIRAKIAERYLDREFYCEYGKLLAKNNKAFEIHGASNTPRKWVLDLLSSMGVCFSIGSDAHDIPLLGRNERAWELCSSQGYLIKEPVGKRRFNICRK